MEEPRRGRRAVLALSVQSLAELLGQPSASLSLRGVCRQHLEGGTVLKQAVWVHGPLLRVESPPGHIDTILGRSFTWHRMSTNEPLRRRERAGSTNPYTAPRILERRPVEEWTQLIARAPNAVLDSVEKTQLHGRAALSLTLPGKHAPIRVVVDTATGTWLEASRPTGVWLDWLEVIFGAKATSPNHFEP